MDYKQEISNLVRKASLPDSDADLWEKIINRIPNELLSDLYDLLMKESDAINYLTQNLRKKYEAIEKGDVRLLDEVFAQQFDFIKSLKSDQYE